MNWRLDGGGDLAGAASDFSATLLAMAGHDLRQPLQVIVGAHDLLARIPHGGAAQTQLNRAEDATRQLADKLDQLVEALRLREFAASDHHEPVPLGPVLEQLASEFAEPVRLKGVKLHVSLLNGILRNLARNAIEYTPRGGRVLVLCRRHGSRVRLEVRDSGIGIPGAELSKVFSAFHRADTTCSDGLGLGLFIVKSAADLLGHRIQVSSVVGRGSCFAIVADAAPPSVAVTASAA
jgi:signal transduction histidine kinase